MPPLRSTLNSPPKKTSSISWLYPTSRTKDGCTPGPQAVLPEGCKEQASTTTTSKITIVPKDESIIALGKHDTNELAYNELTSAAPSLSGFYVTIGNVCSSSEEEAMIKVQMYFCCNVPGSGETDHHLKFCTSSPRLFPETPIIFSLRFQASHYWQKRLILWQGVQSTW